MPIGLSALRKCRLFGLLLPKALFLLFLALDLFPSSPAIAILGEQPADKAVLGYRADPYKLLAAVFAEPPLLLLAREPFRLRLF